MLVKRDIYSSVGSSNKCKKTKRRERSIFSSMNQMFTTSGTGRRDRTRCGALFSRKSERSLISTRSGRDTFCFFFVSGVIELSPP